MSSVVNLAEEVLSGVLQAAEQLQGAIVAAETGCIESLRWSGAMPLLLRDLCVQNVLCASDLLACTSPQDLRHLLLLQETDSVDHIVIMLSGFLWHYEGALKQLLALGVVRRLTVCSSLSEKAHECYDFTKLENDVKVTATGARATKDMKFEEFALELKANATFPTERQIESSQQQSGEDNDWDWNDSESTIGTQRTFAADNSVQVIYLPLNVVPLLWSKTFSPEPSVFVLAHSTCASAFPLLLHQVEGDTTTSPASPTKREGAQRRIKYLRVKDVVPEHIPSAFRRSMRLLAYTLAEMMDGAQLDVKERIFALGATSIKIGHTMLRILNEMEQAATFQLRQEQQAASLFIIDRTVDLVSPCSFETSLLDRILALLPQMPTKLTAGQGTAEDGVAMRRENVIEIYPLNGCTPAPLSELAATSGYQISDFVAQIPWKGGVSLCHPTISSDSNVFRSLAYKSAKLALRDLDKRLQTVEQDLLQQGKLQTAAVTRRRGEKVRGRDVVLRRISKILEAGEPTNLEHSSLVEFGVIVLETLERMELFQNRYDKCRERAVRHFELWKQGRSEWILPEVADVMQRQVAALQAGVREDCFSLQESLTLLVNAFALSAGTRLEDFSVQMVKKALVESVWQALQRTPLSVQAVLPTLYAQLLPLISSNAAQARHSTTDHDTEGDDWDWNDGNTSLAASRQTSGSSDDSVTVMETRLIIETYVESLMSCLEDCKEQCVKLSNDKETLERDEPPRSVLAQLCSSVIDSSKTPIKGVEHIVDASEQLTRAGIDLLKSGFSKFGFGGTDQRGHKGSRLLGDATILIVFIVGGITFEEIQEVHNALSDNTRYQIILGGTTVTNNEVILDKLFTL